MTTDYNQCPDCGKELERTDLAWPASMSDIANAIGVFVALDYAMLLLGLALWFVNSWIADLLAFGITTYLVLKVWKVVVLNRSVYTCVGCERKFTGKNLEPFSWSFYD